MLYPDRIEYRLGGDDFELPLMFAARQLFPHKGLKDVAGEVKAQLATLQLPDLAGATVALTAGSRGVANQATILRATADWLKERGAKPFIVPAMGSHAGARAESQLEFIAGYGITEETMNVPIKSCMDVVQLGATPSGFPVYCDKMAWEAEYIMPVHRIKPHSDFKGPIESGLCKMLVIGLGKHKGATAIHDLGFGVFAGLIPEAARIFLDSGKVLAGLAMVEDAHDETMRIAAIPTGDIIEREKELLAEAKEEMARFFLSSIDVLVVEEVGKDISGAGMDPNITGRPSSDQRDGFNAPPIKRIALLGITELSHGNAGAPGAADVVTVDFMKQYDPAASYTNVLTSRILEGARMPMVANNDRDAMKIALTCCFGLKPEEARIVQIANTLCLSDMLLSEAYLPEIRNDPRFEVLSEPLPVRFDADGRLARLPRAHHSA